MFLSWQCVCFFLDTGWSCAVHIFWLDYRFFGSCMHVCLCQYTGADCILGWREFRVHIQEHLWPSIPHHKNHVDSRFCKYRRYTFFSSWVNSRKMWPSCFTLTLSVTYSQCFIPYLRKHLLHVHCNNQTKTKNKA